MSKTARKTRSETEHLRGEIKKLKSELRRVKRQNKDLDRKSHYYETIADIAIEDVEIKESCTHCGKGTISIIDFTHVKYEICDICETKTKV